MKDFAFLAVPLVLSAPLASMACSSGPAASPSRLVDASTVVDAPATAVEPGDSTDEGAEASSCGPPPWDASAWDEDAAVAAGGDTWANYMQGYFEKFCVECHAPCNASGDDFTQLSNVRRRAEIVRCGIIPADALPDPSWMCAPTPAPGQFPISNATQSNPKPDDAQRWRVVAWIDAGTP